MTRLALLGDSHLASVALAARSAADRLLEAGIHATFFSHTSKRLAGLEAREGALRPRGEDLRRALLQTSGGLDRVDPEAYDRFLLVALGVEFPLHCVRRQFYSRAVTEQAVLDGLSSSLALRLVAELRSLTEKPIWLLPMPLHAPQAGGRPEVITYRRFLELAARFFSGHRVEIVPQPRATRHGDCFTLPELSRRPAAWNEQGALGTTEDDPYHKNEAYGRAVLDDLLVRLEREG